METGAPLRARHRRRPSLPPLVLVVALLAACAARGAGGGGAYPGLQRYAGRSIDAVRFTGTGPYPADTLAAVVRTQPTRCNLLGMPFCIPFTQIGLERHLLSPTDVEADLQRLQLFYRLGGYFGTTVTPDVTEESPGGEVTVTFGIVPGDSVVLDSLSVTGLDGAASEDSVLSELPIHAGDVFDLTRFAQAAAMVSSLLFSRGYAYAQVLRNYDVDTLQNRAVAELSVYPGPVVRVDSILVEGAEHLGRAATLRQLTFHAGDLLQRSKLAQSERNLYGLDLVEIATVTVAPDSLQLTPADSTTATVVARVAESPEHQVEAAFGFGNVECFRTEASWTDRSFGGGARQLAVNASVSKLGVGVGLGGNICSAYNGLPFAGKVDYRLSAALTQPFFLSPRNHLTTNAFVERQSQPSAYVRVGQGGALTLSHRLGQRELLSASITGERGYTRASSAVFCSALSVCSPGDIAELQRTRWRNRLGLGYTRDRTNAPISPTDGYLLRTTAEWSPQWLGSDAVFTRWTGDAARYLPLHPGWVLAGVLHLGSIFQVGRFEAVTSFLPPEERFYAGGANTVRGYGRNALGPGVYVTDAVRVDSVSGDTIPTNGADFAAIGGTSLGIATLELRTPSPVLSQRLGLAFFVDAGAVGRQTIFQLRPHEWRVTPGAGLRIVTPVGPLRLDAAYNPEGAQAAPLYFRTQAGELIRVNDSYRPPRGGFFSHIQIQLAVGQVF